MSDKTTTVSVYPCCAKKCTLRWMPDQGESAIERDHFCDGEDEVGTRYRIRMDRRTIGHGIWLDRIEFMDLASDEAFGLYGQRKIPRRKARS